MSTGPGILNVHRFLPQTSVEGPGVRAALWVQGCPIRCPGCFNPQTWSAQGGTQATVKEALEAVAKAAGGTAKLSSFARFEVGEGLEKKACDFASEVAAQLGK